MNRIHRPLARRAGPLAGLSRPHASPKASDRTRPAGQAATAPPDGSPRTSQPPRASREPASTGPLPRPPRPGGAR
jgi:hypothetical protein